MISVVQGEKALEEWSRKHSDWRGGEGGGEGTRRLWIQALSYNCEEKEWGKR